MESGNESKTKAPTHWCDICSLDLQSSQALKQHKEGQKHIKRAYRAGLGKCPSSSEIVPTTVEEDEFFECLASGAYRNIIVLTGAGVSTASGIPDYRSKGGFFDTCREKYAGRFPGISATPEELFSRSFVEKYPHVWENEMLPSQREMFAGITPTLTHRFCAYLARQGWLKRIYTQNIDGLHSHASLGVPKEKVVECHGSVHRGDVVLYGDPLPRRFFDTASQDFHPSDSERRVDLILVMGTSLQVAPFCGLPNMAPKGCTRALVNRNLTDCITNPYGAQSWTATGYKCNITMKIGSHHKSVPLSSLWMNRDKLRKKKWRQLLVEDDSDKFVERFMKKADAIF